MPTDTVHDRSASKTVLVKRPTQSHRTGKRLGWTMTHALDCKWVAGSNDTEYPYEEVNVSEIPAHVGRCSRCGGGR